MLFRRFALAIAFLFAGLASQLPEFTQQYRQRIGGALDELNAIVTQFDAETAGLSLDREGGITRLKQNTDVLAQQRGTSMAGTIARQDKLERQKRSFETAGPLSQYAVLAEDFDPGIARQAYADYQPAFPVTTAGFASAAVGFVLGWLTTHLAAMPLRRRRVTGTAVST